MQTIERFPVNSFSDSGVCADNRTFARPISVFKSVVNKFTSIGKFQLQLHNQYYYPMLIPIDPSYLPLMSMTFSEEFFANLILPLLFKIPNLSVSRV